MELEKGYYSSPRFSGELLDCSMPVTFDTYDNCAFQCLYCFSQFQRAIGAGKEDYIHHKVHSVNVDAVKRLFRGEIPNSDFNPYIKARMPMQWGGLSDGFDYYERQFGKSLDLLRFFRLANYPLSISTKGTWWLKDARYREAVRDASNVHWKISIVTLDEAKAHELERGVSTPMERFGAISELKKLGASAVTFRFRPFILGISADWPFSDRSRQQIHELVRVAKDSGADSVTTEFMCLETRAKNFCGEKFTMIGKLAGIPDIMKFYAANGYSSGLLRLNYDLKRPYIEALQEAAQKYGLEFFVSDCHHKEKSCRAPCCGLPDKPPFQNYHRGQFAEAILIAKRVGEVHWSDISENVEWLKSTRYFGAPGFNQDTKKRVNGMYMSLYDFVHAKWNDPESRQSPAKYFGGVLVPSEPDANGDIVYLYNEPYVARGERIQSVAELRSHLEKIPKAPEVDAPAAKPESPTGQLSLF